MGVPAERRNVQPRKPAPPKPQKGLSLNRKFSLILILTLFVLVSGAGGIVYQLSVEKLEGEIDKRGANLGASLAALGRPYWNGVISQSPEESTRHLRGILAQTALKHEVFNILLKDDTGYLAAALGTSDAAIAGGSWSRYQIDPDIRIRRDCEFQAGGVSTPARAFEIPVPDPTGKAGIEPGRGSQVTALVLVLNAEPINRTKAALLKSVLITILVAIGAGGFIAYWLASGVTSPLAMLMKDIRTVSAGNLEHRTHAHSHDEIGELAKTFDQMTAGMREARDAALERQAIERDLSLAREIQANLLPKRIPKLKGFEISPFYRSAKEVGGDYYDLIPVSAQHLAIAVGDVSGKGVQGSMVMAMTRAIIRSVAPGVTSASKTLIRANHVLSRDLKPGSFVTLCYLVVNVTERTLTVGRAGHNPLLIYRGETKKTELLNPGGIALGFDPGPIFEKTIREVTVPLHKGDVVVAYTDGVVESMNEAREQYGTDAFTALVAAHAHLGAPAIVKALVADLDRHQGSAPQHDDITVVVLKVI